MMVIHNLKDAGFISDFYAQFPDSSDTHLLTVIVMAINGKQNISNQSGKHLNH